MVLVPGGQYVAGRLTTGGVSALASLIRPFGSSASSDSAALTFPTIETAE